MKVKEFIRKTEIGGAYLLLGKEGYLKDLIIDTISTKWLTEFSKNLNLDIISGEDLDEKNFFERGETLPFMAPKRVLVVKEFGAFLEKKKPEDDFFEKTLSFPESSIIFLVENDQVIKKTSKFYKKFQKYNRVIECDKLEHPELVSFIGNYVNKKEGEISPSDIEFFIYRSQYENKRLDINLYQIINELDKLLSYSKGSINRDGIMASIDEERTDSVFDLLSALGNRDLKKAMEIKAELVRKEEPIPRIIFMIIRQVRLLLSIKLLGLENYGSKEIQTRLGIKAFEFKRLDGQSRSIGLETLRDYYHYLIQADLEIKSSNISEDLVLDTLFMKMAIKKTENF